MKYLFSVMMLTVFNANASLISISYIEGQIEQAKEAASIFELAYDIPKSLIQLTKTHECPKRDYEKSGLYLCIDESSQLVFTGANNFELTKKTILSFTENLGDNYVN